MTSLSAFFVALALSVSAPIAFAQTYYGTVFPGPRFGLIEDDKIGRGELVLKQFLQGTVMIQCWVCNELAGSFCWVRGEASVGYGLDIDDRYHAMSLGGSTHRIVQKQECDSCQVLKQKHCNGQTSLGRSQSVRACEHLEAHGRG